jgi:hypothetical protein
MTVNFGPGVIASVAGSGTLTGGGTIETGGYVLTIPNDGTAMLLGLAQTVSARKTHTATDIFSNMLRNGTVEFLCQDGTPATRNDGTALVADDLWYETDTNILWFWNGTYWLSTQLFTENFSISGAAASATLSHHSIEPMATQHDLFLVDLNASMYVATTNTGSAYWSIEWRRVTAAYGQVALASLNTTAIAADTFTVIKTAVNTHLDLSAVDAKMFAVTAVKTSTPGEVYIGGSFTYRLAHL